MQKIPRGAGGISLADDFKRLYCQDFRDADYVIRDQEEKIARMIKERTFDEENFMVGHMVALLSGIPDFMASIHRYDEGKALLRAGIDGTWDNWAKAQNKKNREDLYYEESLAIELVERDLYFNPFRRKFGVVLDVNLGEYDRANQLVGKIGARFALTIPKSFLSWFKQEWNLLESEDFAGRERLTEVFKKTIATDVERARESFEIPPWKGDLEGLVVSELIEQITRYRGPFFARHEKGMEEIHVQFRYGLFALRYIRFQHEIEREEGKRRQLLESLRATR
jgi:hypothetical protein